MAFFNRTEIGLKKTGESVSIPNDPKARLMYYLKCVSSVLDIKDQPEVARLRRFNTYNTLSESDTNLLISICLLLSPDTLMNKCIFQDDDLCGDSKNEFFKIEAVNKRLMVAGSIMIGGHRKKVLEIMTFKSSWLKKYWIDPIETLQAELQAIGGLSNIASDPVTIPAYFSDDVTVSVARRLPICFFYGEATRRLNLRL